MTRGKHIVVEGIDAAGKSDTAVAIKEHIIDMGKHSALFKAPSYDGPIGLLLRDIFDNKAKVNPLAMMHLFIADEIDQESITSQQLRMGCHVIRDRHTVISGPVYQCEQHSMRTVLRTFPPNLFQPIDVVVLLECDATVAIERRKGRRKERSTGSLYQSESIDHLEKLRDRYRHARYLHDDMVRKWMPFDTTDGITPEEIARVVCIELGI